MAIITKGDIPMKKLISILLTVILILSVAAPCAFAFSESAELVKNVPIIHLRGDGNSIHDQDGNQVYPTGYDTSKLPENIANVIFPYFTNAIMFGKWEEYYDAFEAEITPIFEKATLDKNGNPKNGSDVSQSNKATNARKAKSNYVRGDGTFDVYSYTYWYDWRRDPFEIADLLHEYIESIKSVTGAEKISLSSNCLGGSFILAYIVKYGHADIHAICFDSTVANGCEVYNDLFCGRGYIYGEALQRMLDDTGLDLPLIWVNLYMQP